MKCIKNIAILIALVIIALLLHNCKKSTEEQQIVKEKQDTEVVKKYNDNGIKIGSLFALTGESAEFEEWAFIRPLKSAVESINETGGVLGKKIELIEYDTQSTSIGAKIAADKAVQDGVIAVIGASWSSHSIAAAKVLQEAKIIQISPDSTSPKVTQVGDYIFRTCIVDTYQGKVAAHFVKDELKFSRAAVLVNTDSEYTIGLADIFKEEFKSIQGEIVFLEEYLHKSADFSDILIKVKELAPDIIYLPGRPQDIMLIVLQAQKFGIDTFFIGSDSWNDTRINDFSRDTKFNNYFTAPWTDKNVKDIKQYNFVENYKKMHRGDPGNTMVYNALVVLIESIIKTQSFNTEEIKNAMLNTKSFQVYGGEITFNQYGDPMQLPVAIKTVSNGEDKVFKVVIY